MPDIIQLLPDAVANQIAAGEVIQRPASAVKELLENAVDAGSTLIKLIVKDAGKTLIQVIDNGCGMSETDARMCFERHATSKIKKADDLFAIRTMGFRGEALASIAAIAQVELKTRKLEDETGTLISIEGSEVKTQEACSCAAGTSFAVKNLFYNVPARRNFLKSDGVEIRHIIDEFQRIALAHPEISFSMHHNNAEVFHLDRGILKQRIINIFGASYNQRLVPIEEETNIVTIRGFVGKPEFAKKTRGEQFFFVNKRFIKNAYLHHAVQNAFEQVLSPEHFPSYFLFMEMDPGSIDINIHPTKTEIKFEDDKSIYAILRSAVKRSLGQYNIAPSIDFNQELSFEIPVRSKSATVEAPTIKVDPSFNPFKTEKSGYPYPAAGDERRKMNTANWEKLYTEGNAGSFPRTQAGAVNGQEEIRQQEEVTPFDETNRENAPKLTYQLHNKYILTHIKSGLLIVDQQGAHERILYERFIESMENNKGVSQQRLFPQTLEFSAADFELIKELQAEINALGVDIREFGKNVFVVHGVPPEMTEVDPKEILEGLIENYKQNLLEVRLEKRDNIARAMARNMSVKAGKLLAQEEMTNLIDELFACKMPYYTPSGRPVITTITLEELDKRFKK